MTALGTFWGSWGQISVEGGQSVGSIGTKFGIHVGIGLGIDIGKTICPMRH